MTVLLRPSGSGPHPAAPRRVRAPLARSVAACTALALVCCLPADAGGAQARDPHGVAVIIGNGDYEHRDVPDVAFAHRDADAFLRYVLDVLGFDPDNVIDLRDADRNEMLDALGTRNESRSDVWSLIDPDAGADVVVYYSGHGVPGEQDGRGYLLPVDVVPRRAESDGYPLDVLYGNLGRLEGARSVRVFLDACFSGGSGGGDVDRVRLAGVHDP